MNGQKVLRALLTCLLMLVASSCRSHGLASHDDKRSIRISQLPPAKAGGLQVIAKPMRNKQVKQETRVAKIVSEETVARRQLNRLPVAGQDMREMLPKSLSSVSISLEGVYKPVFGQGLQRQNRGSSPGRTRLLPGLRSEVSAAWGINERPEIILDENDGVVLNDRAIEKTYSLPDIDAVTFWNFNHQEQPVGVGVELVEVKPAKFGAWKLLNIGVAPNNSFIYSTYRITSIVEVSAGPFFGYNWRPNLDDERPGFFVGFGITLSKF